MLFIVLHGTARRLNKSIIITNIKPFRTIKVLANGYILICGISNTGFKIVQSSCPSKESNKLFSIAKCSVLFRPPCTICSMVSGIVVQIALILL